MKGDFHGSKGETPLGESTEAQVAKQIMNGKKPILILVGLLIIAKLCYCRIDFKTI